MQEDMMSLLLTTRQVNRALQDRTSHAPDYNKMAAVLCEFAQANVYIVAIDGTIKGWSWVPGYTSHSLQRYIESGAFPTALTKKLSILRETQVDRYFAHEYDDRNEGSEPADKVALLVPIAGSTGRLGTLLLSRVGTDFPPQDLVLAEYLATLTGIEILNERNRQIEQESRERLVVQMAMGALSFSERESVRYIMEELGCSDGVVIASRIADRVGVTRSVIVNALRKLEGAGIIESRSLGMKGTHIKVLCPLFLKEIGVTICTDDRS